MSTADSPRDLDTLSSIGIRNDFFFLQGEAPGPAEVAVPSAVQMQYSPFPHPAMVGAGFYGPQIPRTVPMPLAYSLPI